MKDIAALAGVSMSTVSQYINGRFEYMSEETKRKIQTIIEQEGYMPNINARNLKVRKQHFVAVIVSNLFNTLNIELIRKIEEILENHNIQIVISNSDESKEKEARDIRLFLSQQVDAMVIIPTGDNLPLYQEIIARKVPIVFADRMPVEMISDGVLLDNGKAITMAFAELMKSAPQEIGIILPEIKETITPRIERLAGYRSEMNRHGLTVVEEYILTGSFEAINTKLKRLYESDLPFPKAWIAGNEVCLRELAAFLLSINDHEVELVGIDENDFVMFLTNKITVLAQPVEEMGEKIAELILQKIAGKEATEGRRFRFAPIVYTFNE